jgi:hypothetical protein
VSSALLLLQRLAIKEAVLRFPTSMRGRPFARLFMHIEIHDRSGVQKLTLQSRVRLFRLRLSVTVAPVPFAE